MNLINVLHRPTDYLKALKFLVAGWYFDVFKRKFTAGGCSFEIPESLTTRAGRGYFALDLYENVERKLVSDFIKGNERVLELGACIGIISCIVNKRLNDPSKHVVVEANPKVIPYLNNNKQMNGCKFSIENCVISSNKEEIFSFGDSIVSGSLLQKAGQVTSTAVKGVRIEDLEKNHHFEFDTLIIDIEGGEYNLLLENKNKLKQFRMIIIENHPHLLADKQIKEYEGLLEENNFSAVQSLETSKVWLKA